MQSDNRLLANAACIYVHNALKKLCHNYFTMEKKDIFLQLLKPAKEGFTSAKDALLFLLHQPNIFEDVYNNILLSLFIYFAILFAFYAFRVISVSIKTFKN